MKKLKISIIIGIMALMLSAIVSANEGDCRVTPDFSSNKLVVDGVGNASEHITIMLLEDGITLENYWSKIPDENIKNTTSYGGDESFETVVADVWDAVSYVYDFYTDANGNFSHTMGIEKTGIYDVYLLYSNSGELKVIDNVCFTASDDYRNKIDELNSMDKVEFISELTKTETLRLLGVEDEINSIVDAVDIAEILYTSASGAKLTYDFSKNKALYRACGAIVALNEGKDTDVSYLNYILSDDETLAKYCSRYLAGNEEFIIDYLKNKNVNNVDELTIKVEEAILLVLVKNPNGYENIKGAFNDFKSITGVSSPSSNNMVYSKLAGRNFDGITALVDAYTKILNEVSSGSGGSGGGGGGGGSSSGGGASLNSGGDKYIQTIEPISNESISLEEINKNIFEDLESVPWAQRAIVNLAAIGVINGKSDSVFAPNDYITREEFTKLVVAAFAENVTPVDIEFKDIETTRWSYSYIAKAKAAGIINGYSNNLFGTTDLITRQDMSLIIYNAAKYKEMKFENTDKTPVFADDKSIADYAKEAVYKLKVMGIVNGTDAMHFEPDSLATRAQAAVMIYRLLLK